ncbi:hypothetical protein JXM83_01815 [Candidatus Woesearchaeota archaeon]|nr:hypothetical protein [Candidatus Woesearchaeota archaeon]
MKLIDELTTEHKTVARMFKTLKYDNKVQLEKLKEFVVAHLDKENKQLYPVLLKSNTQEIAQTGKLFMSYMETYSRDFIVAVDNLIKKQTKKTVQEFEDIRDLILKRLLAEEKILFGAYKSPSSK